MQTKEKIVVLGAQGMLGSELVSCLASDKQKEVIGLDIDKIDISNKEHSTSILKTITPSLIINCAGFTDVEGCENHDKKDLAMEINGYAPGRIASFCKKNNIHFIHISTDYVFDGKGNAPIEETSTTNPCNFYGKTKAMGEQMIQKHGSNYLIIRTSWLYGLKGKNFVKTVLKLANNSEKEIKIVNDQTGTPTNVNDLSTMIKHLLYCTSEKIIHATNQGYCTWYEFAKKIIDFSNIKKDIIPITSLELKTKAKRPTYSVLSLKKLEEVLPISIRNWDDALKNFINEVKSNPTILN